MVHVFTVPQGGTVGILDFVPVGVTLSFDVIVVRPQEILFSMQFPEPVPFNGGGLTNVMITALTIRSDDMNNVAQVTEVGVYGCDIEGFQIVDVAATSSPVSTTPGFLRGDATASGAVDMTDAIVTLEVVLLGQGSFACLDAADANDDGQPDMTDAIVTLEEIFLGRVHIPSPGTHACGIDPTSDSIGCESYDACP
jgi:hypothetical protein